MNRVAKKANINLRFNIITVLVYLVGIILIARLFNLQIVHGAEYREQSNTRLTRESTIEAARGAILDRTGQELVTSDAEFSLEMYKTKVDDQTLNQDILNMVQVLEKFGCSYSNNFPINVEPFEFTISGDDLTNWKEDYDIDENASYGFISYFVSTSFESFDRRYYPNKGLSFRAEYALHTDNFATYNNDVPFSSLMFDFQPVVRLTNRIYLLPALYGRILIGNNVALPYMNLMGGEVFGRYMNQQLPFYGVHNMEIFDNSLIVVRLSARQRLWRRHYLTISGNYAKQSGNFIDILKGGDILGGGLTYAYNSLIGPISLTFDGSNWTRSGIGVYFNMGFYF